MSKLAASPQLTVLAFTDVVKFTEMKSRLGDAVAATVLSRHDKIVHSICEGISGAEVLQDKGDGFLLRFATASDGVDFALRLQYAIAHEKWDEAPIQVRVGIHLGEVREIESLERGYNKVMGLTVDLTERVTSLASGGQILLTRGAFDIARQNIREHPRSNGEQPPRLRWMAHGPYLFAGTDEPTDIFEVGAEGIAPLHEPADSNKAKRAIMAGEEVTLGWRPAAGLEIPGRPGWILDRKLGEGGFGEVWLGSQRKLGTHRVYKFCFDSDRLRSLKREMALFRLLRDTLGDRPDIARLHEVNLDHSPFFLESEYTAGGNLCEWAEQHGGIGTIPMNVRLDFVARIADAIGAAHRAGVLHKDIKPTNILVYEAEDGSPRPRLSDFGIGMVESLDTLRKHNITVAGFTMMTSNDSSRTGTRMYSPPELLIGQKFTMQGDIYSLGVLLYQVVVADLNRPMAHGWERDISDPLLRQDISDCAVGDPERRLRDATELAFRLRSIEARRKAIADAEQAERHAEKVRHAKRMILAGAAGLIVAVGVVFAMYRIQLKSRMELAKQQQTSLEAQNREREATRESQMRTAEVLLASAQGMLAAQQYPQATDAFKKAAASAEASGLNPEFTARALIDGAQCAMSAAATSLDNAVQAEHSPQPTVKETAPRLRQEAAGFRATAADFAKRCSQQLDALTANASFKPTAGVATIYNLLGRMNLQLAADGDAAERTAAAKKDFDAAILYGQPFGDSVLLASAQADLAEVYAGPGASSADIDKAIRYTRQALDSAANTGRKELQYLHQWQLGKLYRRSGKLDQSMLSYESAGETAATMGYSGDWFNNPKYDPATGQRLAQLYGEIADVSLFRADKVGKLQAQDALSDARIALERRQIAELQDFYGATSQIALNLSLPRVGSIQPHVAVIYLLPLADHLELLVAIENTLTHVPVPAGLSQLDETVASFRSALADTKTTRYTTSGAQLYKWLIEPIAPLLAEKKIDTLTFVPEGMLRTVPLSALYDPQSNTHLIEQYAVCIVPGLALTVSSSEATNQPPRVLCVGMTTPGPDGAAPRNIVAEMSMVEHAFPTPGEKLFDDEFDFANIFRQVKKNRYSIIHIASQTQFDSMACHCSIRTSDEKQPLTLDKLEKLGKLHSLELLVLSCAQTLPGDDHAATGLAGIAYNSGVAAAVATLWNSNDPAAADLLLEFYHQLAPQPGSPDQHRPTKAKAMQAAQKKMIKEGSGHHHPYVWSPYLVIGESPMG